MELTLINIPNTVTSIGSSAFSGCKNLFYVTIPDSIKTIDSSTFEGCAFASISIPESVTSIGSWAFRGNKNLTSITIPKSVNNIGSDAFSYCYFLKTVTCNATTVPKTGDAFKSIDPGAELYVPESALEDYKTAAYWRDFGTIKSIEGTKSATEPIITYSNGKLNFSSDTPNATYSYSVLFNPTVISGTCTGAIDVEPSFTVKAFTKAVGYSDSKEVSSTFYLTADTVHITETDTLYQTITDSIYITETDTVFQTITDSIYVTVTDTVFQTITDSIYVTVTDTVFQTITDTIYVTETDTVYIYDDSRSDIAITEGSTITLSVRDGIIYIDNAPVGEIVYVYSEGGEMIECQEVKSQEHSISLPRNRMYIIKIKEKVIKVRL